MLAEYYRTPERFMNIFFLDDDPAVSAQAHCDRHVVKMVLETAQILSTVWHSFERKHTGEPWAQAVFLDWSIPAKQTPYGELKWLHASLCGQRIYRPTHEGHPCVQWASLYGGNYAWLYQLGMALLEEYRYRYNRIHACTPVLRALELVPPPLLDTTDKYCDAPAVMPSEFIVGEDAANNYQNYYRKGKTGLLQFTRREPPTWLSDLAIYKEV